MEYEEIMESIAQGLTGDNNTDIQYLYAMAQEYKDHELSKEISRACGRMIYDLLSEDQKNEFETELDHDLQGVRESLDELSFLISKNDIDKAVELSASLVKTADEIPIFKDDTRSRYFNFLEPFEEMLFTQYNGDGKDIRRADYPFTSIYSLYGSLMVETGRYDEAAASLRKALKWDPANCGIAFEYAEALKLSGDLEAYAETTRNYYKYAYKPEHLARYYRNLGYYFVGKKQYEEAAACYQVSAGWCDTEKALAELYYIQEKTGTVLKPFTPEEIKEIAQREGFCAGPCEAVLNCAVACGTAFLKSNKVNGAIYCYSIYAELTHDEEIAQMVEQLKSIVEASQEERKGG